MMLRVSLFVVGLLAAGTAGWLLANHWNQPGSPRPELAATPVQPAVRLGPPRLSLTSTTEAPERGPAVLLPANAPQQDQVSGDVVLLQLQARLDDEVAQRRWLERRVQELAQRLERVEDPGRDSVRKPMAALASAPEAEEGRDDPVARAQARTARFLSVGFNEEDEKELTRRMDEVEMESLYLRDTARREGWLRTPQYREAAGELRNELRNDIGEEAYDRLLYASERDNRVLVDSVLASSPAQEIGLQSGDVIVSYDETRVFSRRDIRTAARQGQAGDAVTLHVERNGQVLELEIPRGPLGVRLGSSSVMP